MIPDDCATSERETGILPDPEASCGFCRYPDEEIRGAEQYAALGIGAYALCPKGDRRYSFLRGLVRAQSDDRLAMARAKRL